MAYRQISKWKIDLAEPKKDRGLFGWRETFGIGEYKLPIGIKFKNREVRLIFQSSDLISLAEVQRVIPELARIRYQYHHTHGTGYEWNRSPREQEIESFLESVGIHLPGWLR